MLLHSSPLLMRLLLLISALWICVGCGSSGDRIPLEMQAREPSVAESVAAVQLTFDPSEDEPIEVVEASMRIDASTPIPSPSRRTRLSSA